MDPIRRLILEEWQWQHMINHANTCLPEEACGLVGGRFSGEIAFGQVVYPVVNALHSPFRFRMDPNGQLSAFLDIEKRSLELIGIFHTHPQGPDIPSETDLAEFLYPGVVTIILSPGEEPTGWRGRAFSIVGDHFSDVVIEYEI